MHDCGVSESSAEVTEDSSDVSDASAGVCSEMEEMRNSLRYEKEWDSWHRMLN